MKTLKFNGQVLVLFSLLLMFAMLPLASLLIDTSYLAYQHIKLTMYTYKAAEDATQQIDIMYLRSQDSAKINKQQAYSVARSILSYDNAWVQKFVVINNGKGIELESAQRITLPMFPTFFPKAAVLKIKAYAYLQEYSH
jgi:hypothetical protein